MIRIDQRGERRLRGVVPLTGRRFAAGVLRGGDDLEVLRLQFVVECLPAWQVKSAPSPGGPGDEQYFLAAELRQADRTSFAIGNRDVGRHARFEIRAAHDWNLGEAPHP